VGLFYGGLLARDGAALHVLARSDAAALGGNGVEIRFYDGVGGPERGRLAVRPAAVSRVPEELGAADWVLVAAKATVNETLPDSLRALVRPGRTVLLTLQNGMGNAEFLARHFPDNPVLAGLCFVCVNRVEPGVVENYHPGQVVIGSLDDRWPELTDSAVEAFSSAGVRTRAAPSLEEALWRKLCWNVPFNGLSIAAGGITTDRILGDAGLAARARRLMVEIRAAAGARGLEIPGSFLDGQFEVTAGMGAYRPSSLIDFQAGRAVEIEAIWGEPLRRGRKAGMAMPELEKLYGELKQLCPETG
jgi:2-dehydropantoate 2-reductase